MEAFDVIALPCEPPATCSGAIALGIFLREEGERETLNAILTVSVLTAAAVIFLAMSIIRTRGMRRHSSGALMEHHEVPELVPPARSIHGD